MIAVDTNVLVYAHREDSEFSASARRRIEQLAQGRSLWALPWPCLHEFFSIVTHPRIFDPPTPQELAIDQVEAWLESPSVVLLSETQAHWSELRALLVAGHITGPLVHDARVAAICLQHGVRELWSSDRDFGRFPSLTVVNPLTTD
ncbi:MAG TPA: TA system VapC family ribonuclease toxin [Terriglobia bacterium]|nr:TA system VapC family ribonuclease toxin [Terriglobia bacterium]